MPNKLALAIVFLGSTVASAALTACQNADSSNEGSSTSNGSSSSGSGSASGGSASSGGGSAAGEGGAVADAQMDGGAPGLLVDDMTATKGTQISLSPPAGDSPGSYYAYSDYPLSAGPGGMSIVTGTAQLADNPVTPPVTNADGTKIVGELCFGGEVVEYAGLGMSLVYGHPPDASPESGTSSPIPFDASGYSGVSFYVLVTSSESGSTPAIHFSIPDTQTADPAAWPAAACNVDGGKCDDDFGSDITSTPGTWTKVSFRWADLSQVGFGSPFTTIKTSQLIGMKWQANGGGAEASVESFNFCISDIYFTP